MQKSPLFRKNRVSTLSKSCEACYIITCKTIYKNVLQELYTKYRDCKIIYLYLGVSLCF